LPNSERPLRVAEFDTLFAEAMRGVQRFAAVTATGSGLGHPCGDRGEHISKTRVSQMSKVLDAQVSAFRNRALDAGPYSFVWMDALTQKVREGGRTVNVHVLVATGVNADGHREILGRNAGREHHHPSGHRLTCNNGSRGGRLVHHSAGRDP
jgi:hypothetical protein